MQSRFDFVWPTRAVSSQPPSRSSQNPPLLQLLKQSWTSKFSLHNKTINIYYVTLQIALGHFFFFMLCSLRSSLKVNKATNLFISVIIQKYCLYLFYDLFLLAFFSKFIFAHVFVHMPWAPLLVPQCSTSLTWVNLFWLKIMTVDCLSWMTWVWPSTNTQNSSYMIPKWSCNKNIFVVEFGNHESKVTTIKIINKGSAINSFGKRNLLENIKIKFWYH